MIKNNKNFKQKETKRKSCCLNIKNKKLSHKL